MNNIDNGVQGIILIPLADQLWSRLDAQVSENAWSPCRDQLEEPVEARVCFAFVWRKFLDDNGQQH